MTILSLEELLGDRSVIDARGSRLGMTRGARPASSPYQLSHSRALAHVSPLLSGHVTENAPFPCRIGALAPETSGRLCRPADGAPALRWARDGAAAGRLGHRRPCRDRATAQARDRTRAGSKDTAGRPGA